MIVSYLASALEFLTCLYAVSASDRVAQASVYVVMRQATSTVSAV